MLKVDNISLYYGAAQALRGVSLSAEPGKVTCVGPQRRRQDLVASRDGRPIPDRGRFDRLGGHDITGLNPTSAHAPASASCRRAARSFRC